MAEDEWKVKRNRRIEMLKPNFRRKGKVDYPLDVMLTHSTASRFATYSKAPLRWWLEDKESENVCSKESSRIGPT